MINTPLSFTIQDACKATGLGRTTLYALIGEGKLDACKAGTRTLIRAESLKKYIDGLEPTGIGATTRARA